jgi:hypothetical protein
MLNLSYLINKIGVMEADCEDGRWMELPQDRVEWWALELVGLNLCILLAN